MLKKKYKLLYSITVFNDDNSLEYIIDQISNSSELCLETSQYTSENTQKTYKRYSVYKEVN